VFSELKLIFFLGSEEREKEGELVGVVCWDQQHKNVRMSMLQQLYSIDLLSLSVSRRRWCIIRNKKWDQC
jgi:hypothetical protein